MQIRGTFLKDYVKIVRATQDADWGRFLTADDWEIINSMIIPSAWYPAETMGRIARGLYELHSNHSYEFIRAFARAQAPVYLEDVRQFLQKGDIRSALNAYIYIVGRFVDEISVSFVESGHDFVKVSFYPVNDAPSFDCYREVMAGYLEWLVAENGGKNPQSEFESNLREDKEECVIRVDWQR